MEFPFHVALARQARATLPGDTTLQPFVTGGLGNFPYVWRDPRNQLFNSLTYEWISANLKAGAMPIRQASGSTFTNLATNALASVSYSLSTGDQTKLRAASDLIVKMQGLLLGAWKAAFGSIPTAAAQPQAVDAVIEIVSTQWADPATTLRAMQDAPHLDQLLNQVPASGKPVMPYLVNYINSLNSSDSLQSASPSATGYLDTALDAARNPSPSNGGLETNRNQYVPAYEVSTPLDEILSGLDDSSSGFKIASKVTLVRDDQIRVELPGQPPAVIHPDDLLVLSGDEGSANFSNFLRSRGDSLELELAFSGTTMVNFQPVAFSKSGGAGWFWNEPLVESVQTGSSDVTGFRFAPSSRIDFSKDGPFSFLTGVAISNTPSVRLRMPNAPRNDLSQFSGSRIVELLGNPLGGELVPPEHELKIEPHPGSNTTELRFDLKRAPGATVNVDSRAWVHGVEIVYPVADAL